MSSTESPTSNASIPSLLPQPSARLNYQWQPSQYKEPPIVPIVEAERFLEPPPSILALQGPNGEFLRLPKKVKPRRTVDYNGGVARWKFLRRLRPNAAHPPFMRPNPSFIIDLLPPKAYPDNATTSLCTKFVHTSTNKIRFPVNVVAWTPEGRRVLTGSTSGEFTLWNGLTFNFETILQAHDAAIRAFQFSHSGAYLVSADQSGVIKYFQPNMNNLAARQGHRDGIRGLSFSPDDKRFVTCSDDQTLKIWAFDEMREESSMAGHGWDVKCVQWHPIKGLLASGSKDNLVKFWDPRSGQVLSSLHYHKNTVQALQWSPNGNFLATASRDQTVRVFDIRAMKEFQVFKGHAKDVCSVAWHPVHHDLLASGGAEGAIHYWLLSPSTASNTTTTTTSKIPTSSSSSTITPTTTVPRASIPEAHDQAIWDMAFHPLGHLLCSVSNDYTTRFWSRERPGEKTDAKSFGEKPPGVNMSMGGGGGANDEDDDDGYLPGFVGGGGGLPQQSQVPFSSGEMPGLGYGADGSFGNGAVPGLGLDAAAGGGGEDGFIPGFGGPSAATGMGMGVRGPGGPGGPIGRGGGMMSGQGNQQDGAFSGSGGYMNGGSNGNYGRDGGRGGYGGGRDRDRNDDWHDRDRDNDRGGRGSYGGGYRGRGGRGRRGGGGGGGGYREERY